MNLLLNGTDQEHDEMRRGITLADIGVIASIGLSVLTTVFFFGFVYGDVTRTRDDVHDLKPKVEALTARLERIDGNVSLLVDIKKNEIERAGNRWPDGAPAGRM